MPIRPPSVPPALRETFSRMLLGRHGIAVSALAVAAFSLAAMWAGTLTRVANENALAIDGSIDGSRNIAAIVAANLDDILGRSLLYAKIGKSYVEGDRAAASYLNPQMVGDAVYLRMALFDASGRLLHSSANRRTEPELAPMVARAIATAPADGQAMWIGNQHPSEATAWRVPLVVPLDPVAPLGYFAAIIDLGYFLKLYNNVDLGESGRIEIVRTDGLQLVEMSGATLSAGARLGATDTLRLLQRAQSEGVVRNAAIDDLAPAVGAYRRLQRYPVAVVVTRDQESVVGPLDARHRRYYGTAGLFSVVMLCMALGLIVISQRQRRLYEVLQASEQEKQGLIQQLEGEKSRAYQLASHDYLTGIPNRMLFYELATAELSRAQRSRNVYALLFFDLDRFKMVNDTLGHGIGDLLLQAVARRLREALREYDLVARLGGDEFVVLLSEMPSEEQVAQIGAKLVETLSAPYLDLDGHDVDTSPSVGIALYPRDGHSIEMLLTHADAAMYVAKSAGKGLYRFFDASLNASSAREFELVSRFRRAIKDNEFRLHYQPRVHLDDFRIAGLEALVRWQHPEDGLIFPGDFIPLAEEHDYIVALGHWVIDAVCAQIAQWRAEGVPPVPVAINVSARQLRDDALVSTVLDALARHDVPVELLEIEITESCLIEDPELARQVLERLQAHGILIALDDYGTGFSGLSNLKTLPIYAVKIDRSFIRDIRNDTYDAVIVSSTISLAHTLGMTVVAEGVESKAQLVHLKTAGCDQVQGFYLQRPASPAEMAPLLRRGHLNPA